MLSLVIPAFNESENLKKNIPKLVEHLNSEKKKYEIIISEDGSTDNTYGVLKALSKKYGLRFIHGPRRLGKGGALKRASLLVRGDRIIFMDADMPASLDSLDIMERELEKNDIVIGSRYTEGSKTSRAFRRYVLSRLYHLLVRMIFPELKFSDVKCGFKGFRKNAFISVNKMTKENGWNWDLEFLLRARKMGFRIKEIPVEWKERRHSKVNLLKESFLQIFDILKIRLRVLF